MPVDLGLQIISLCKFVRRRRKVVLENFIEYFRRQDMLKLVLDNYVPADRDYYVMELQDDTFQEKIHFCRLSRIRKLGS